MAHDTLNYASIGYADNPELNELIGETQPGEEIEYKIKMKVRRNEGGILIADITEIILPDGKAEPVTDRSQDEGGTAVATVLSDDSQVDISETGA